MFYLYFIWPTEYFSALCLHKIHFCRTFPYFRSLYPHALVASIFHHIRQMSSKRTLIHPGRFLSLSSFHGMKLIFQVMWALFCLHTEPTVIKTQQYDKKSRMGLR